MFSRFDPPVRPGPAAAKLATAYLLLVLAATSHWFVRKFGRVDLDQLLFHLQQPADGLLSADAELVRSGILNVLLAPALVLLLAAAFWLVLRRWRPLGRLQAQALRWPGLAAALLATAAWAFHSMVVLPAPGLERRDWIADLYRTPAQVQPPARKKNLVLIYAESLEATYASPAFPEDLLRPLQERRATSLSFDTFGQAAGTGWTIAGIVGSQCGLPLKPLGIFGENQLGVAAHHFLPGARCLGDVLKAAGYRNVFLGGASTQFAGKGLFLHSHGYDEVLGREQWLAREPQRAMNDWGLNDDALFTEALAKLAELSASGKPFNLTLLTVGMHPPRGYLAPSCAQPYGDMRDSVLCTARLLRDFITEAERRGLLAQTEVVVMGDHLGMASELSPRLERASHRSIYNQFVNAGPARRNRSQINHFDLLPTLLVSLGFRFPHGQFGLGCSALGPVDCSPLPPGPVTDARLRAASHFYESLWLTDEDPGLGS